MHTVLIIILKMLADDDYCLYSEPIVMHFAHLKEQ